MPPLHNALLSAGVAAVMLTPFSAIAASLNCTMTRYNDGPYTAASVAPLLPLTQHHQFKDGTARSGEMVGVVTQDDDARISWKYQVTVEQNSGMTATISYTFLRAIGLMVIRVEPGGNLPRLNSNRVKDFQFAITVDATGEAEYLPIRRVDGTCSEGV